MDCALDAAAAEKMVDEARTIVDNVLYHLKSTDLENHDQNDAAAEPLAAAAFAPPLAALPAHQQQYLLQVYDSHHQQLCCCLKTPLQVSSS